MTEVDPAQVPREAPTRDSEQDLELYLEKLESLGVETLWHYTDAQGLMGILRSSSIWATSHEFLNDSSEIDYSIAMFQEKLQDVLSETETVAMMDALKGTFAPNSHGSVFIACFSENGDQLSQWRGYGGVDSYAIGFSTRALMTQARHSRSMIGRVKYGEEAAEKAAHGWAEKVLSAWHDRYPKGYGTYLRGRYSEVDPENDHWVIEEMAKDRFEFDHQNINHLILTAALHKDSAFSEEAEWRIYQPSTLGPDRQQVQFRTGLVGITPYITIPIQDSPSATTISSIMIGPGSDAEIREQGLRKFLDSLSYPRSTRILKSQAPYRN